MATPFQDIVAGFLAVPQWDDAIQEVRALGWLATTQGDLSRAKYLSGRIDADPVTERGWELALAACARKGMEVSQ